MQAFKCELSDAGFLENIYRAFPFFTRNTGGGVAGNFIEAGIF